MKPRVSILDKAFKYTNAASTDLRETFARVRRKQLEADQLKAEREAATAKKVMPLKAGRVNEGEKK